MLAQEGADRATGGYATSIYDLAKLVRRAHYVCEYDRVQAQDLLRLRSGNEILSRLCRTMRGTAARLVDCISRENCKREFCELYGTMMRQADVVLEHVDSRDCTISDGFVKNVTANSRSALLQFLHTVRTDHAWVAERLSNLTVSELDSLLPTSEFATKHSSVLREVHEERDEVHDLQRTNALNNLLFFVFAPAGAFPEEDKLRLDLTSTVLHRLIKDNKTSSKGDKFCLATLDAWAGLYGWDAAKSFEILLMEILQSGTKIIEKAEARSANSNTQHRSYYFNNHSKRDESEDEFFAVAVKNIFQLLNTFEISGLPAGALILSRAILSRTDEGDKKHHESFIIINWFFYRFLSKAISYPEQLGMMNDYYISDIKRQRILMVLLHKVHGYCTPTPKSHNMTHKRSLIDEEIESHVSSIFSKFRTTRQESLPSSMLRPTGQHNFVSRSMRTYSEVATPSICLCAADCLTLLSALSPHYRTAGQELGPSTTLSRHKSTSSTGSGRSSAFRPARSSKNMFDLGSSLRDEDARSDATTDVDDSPELTRAPSSSYFTPIFESRVEDEVLQKAEDMMLELSETCDVHATSTITAVSWDQFFVYPDHVSLVDHACVSREIESETPDIVHVAIYHLLENFEIEPSGRIRSPANQQYSYFGSSGAEFSGQSQGRRSPSDTYSDSNLLQLLLSAAQRCLGRRDYSAAGTYYKAHNKLQRLWQSAQASEDFSPILYGFAQEQERIIEFNEQRSEERIQLSAHASENKAHLLQLIDHTIHQMNKIRLKMWYVADIRKYKMWNQAWDVVKCLNKMKPSTIAGDNQRSGMSISETGGNPFSFHARRPSSLSRSNSRDHRFPRFSRDLRQSTTSSASLNGMAVVDQAIFEAIAASPEQGGPNKLSGAQAKQTTEWMRASDIHNFCQGEERLHRLCHEIDDLARRIMKINSAALNTMDIDQAMGSSLWSFDLFLYECSIFKITKKTKYESSQSDPNLSTSGLDDSTVGIGGLLRRGSAGDLLTLARTAGRARVNSAGSLDRPRSRSYSCAAAVHRPIELLSEGLGSTVSLVSLEQSHSRNHERAYDLKNSHTDKTVSEVDGQAVKDFLLQTQIGLTALLLSDFAELLFYRGSETDEWYNDDLTEVALARKQAQETKLHECIAENCRINLEKIVLTPPNPADIKQKNLSKKHIRGKSTNLSHFFSGAPSPGESYKSAPAPPSIDMGATDSPSGVSMERTSSAGSYLDVMTGSDSSMTPITPARSMTGRATQPQQFPLTRAYREILQKFSSHPSPYEKLRALYDFELLIVANLRSSGRNFDLDLPKLAPTMPQSPMLQSSKSNSTISPAALKQHVHMDSEDLLKLRVENLAISSAQDSAYPSATPTALHTPMYSPGTDAIVEEMQRLLRNSDLRPKTLFRDLQYIASFIPATILNMTDEGKVFWDVGLAALGMKRETVEAMVEYGTSIVRQLNSPGPAVSVNNKLSSQEGVLADAIDLFVIAAKEQDVTAMRELATLQSTKPESVAAILPPFTDPSAIFAKAARRERRLSVNSSTIANVNKALAAEAWFELAAAEGDSVARSWLASKHLSQV